eukprot:TRINITY_DN23988_c0_g1_i1.p2 TRINITY_DN23988_c0_g1~~TRINITY_DN23988_c0_g1_i1.p2  ORF type:complete len:363 (+),score=92.94 TRINITY_DN23988_c0_g1_i1:76-1164(+)
MLGALILVAVASGSDRVDFLQQPGPHSLNATLLITTFMPAPHRVRLVGAQLSSLPKRMQAWVTGEGQKPWRTAGTPARFREALSVVCQNLANHHFKEVVTLHEGKGANGKPEAEAGLLREALTEVFAMKRIPGAAALIAKLRVVAFSRQPAYLDLLEFADKHLPNRTVVLANADVVFDETLGLVDPDVLGRRHLGRQILHVISVQPPRDNDKYKFWHRQDCIVRRGQESRCDRNTSWGAQHLGSSFDAFVYRPPLPVDVNKEELRKPADFRGKPIPAPRPSGIFMNQMGAENRVAAMLQLAGMRLINTCAYVRAEHWHCLGKKQHNEVGSVHRPLRGLGKVMPCDAEAGQCVGLRPGPRVNT